MKDEWKPNGIGLGGWEYTLISPILSIYFSDWDEDLKSSQ